MHFMNLGLRLVVFLERHEIMTLHFIDTAGHAFERGGARNSSLNEWESLEIEPSRFKKGAGKKVCKSECCLLLATTGISCGSTCMHGTGPVHFGLESLMHTF